jgi:hypothetical protein
MVPKDAWWPVRLSAPDGFVRGDDEVDTEVVEDLREGLVHDLERVHRGGQHRVRPKHASLDQEGNLQVGESSALTNASTVAVDGDAAADDQVHRWQFGGGDLSSGLGRAFLGGCLPWGMSSPSGSSR